MTYSADASTPAAPDGSAAVNKIAEVTAAFWLLKIIATTLGETAGDFLAQTLGLGYVAGLGITGALLVAMLIAQVRAERFHPLLFWGAIIATTTAGTEISDMMDRTFGLGYVVGAAILAAGLAGTLAVWWARERDLSVDPLVRSEAEILFWVAVLFSNSLGTAFGDALVDVARLGYGPAALVTSAVIGVVLALHYLTRINPTALFWIAFIFTRPFGATFGDLLTKPSDHGGLALGTLPATGVEVALMAVVLGASILWGRRAGDARPALATDRRAGRAVTATTSGDMR